MDVLNNTNRIHVNTEDTYEDEFVKNKIEFINKFKQASNTANATIDDNSNVANKNLAILNAEIHKTDNVRISRAMVMGKLKELYPEFNSKRYIRDLEDHVIYKHDESSFGAIAPYCVSVTMYPFLMDGIKGLGGLSASPKNLKSFCGIFCNMIFHHIEQDDCMHLAFDRNPFYTVNIDSVELSLPIFVLAKCDGDLAACYSDFFSLNNLHDYSSPL
jgi:hypothetical protein